MIDTLKGAKYFTAMDIRRGYNNIRIEAGDEWKAAFRTNRGLYEPLVMFFWTDKQSCDFSKHDERHITRINP